MSWTQTSPPRSPSLLKWLRRPLWNFGTHRAWLTDDLQFLPAFREPTARSIKARIRTVGWNRSSNVPPTKTCTRTECFQTWTYARLPYVVIHPFAYIHLFFNSNTCPSFEANLLITFPSYITIWMVTPRVQCRRILPTTYNPILQSRSTVCPSNPSSQSSGLLAITQPKAIFDMHLHKWMLSGASRIPPDRSIDFHGDLHSKAQIRFWLFLYWKSGFIRVYVLLAKVKQTSNVMYMISPTRVDTGFLMWDKLQSSHCLQCILSLSNSFWCNVLLSIHSSPVNLKSGVLVDAGVLYRLFTGWQYGGWNKAISFGETKISADREVRVSCKYDQG